MRKMMIYAGVLLFAVACNTTTKSADETATTPATETTAAASTADYAYTLKRPYQDWQPGDQKNAAMSLKMLKAWETKKVAECVSYFGDSSEMNFDNYHKTLSHDSITPFIERSWANLSTVRINMQDWESVISADKKEQWVTLWYKQVWTDKKGKADSVNIVDDLKFENGKVIDLDEYTQQLSAKK